MNEICLFTDVKPGGRIQENISAKLKEELPKFIGKRVFIKIGLARKIRSLDANAYYHAVVVECCRQGILDVWGEKVNKEQAHELLKTHCNFIKKIDEMTDSQVRIALPTHNLSSTEFGEYIERCCKFIGEMFSIVVPEAGSQAELAV